MKKQQRMRQVSTGVSVLARGPNTFRIKIALGRNAEGKYEYEYETVHGTAAEAELRKAQIIAERAAMKAAAVTGNPLASAADIKLVDYVREYIDMMEEKAARDEISPTSVEHARKMLRYASPYLGDVKLREFNRDAGKAFIKQLQARRPRWGNAMVGAIKVRISAALTQAVEDNLIEANPLYRLNSGKIKRSAGRVATADERSKQLQPVLRAHRFGFLVRFQLAMGMRRGECCALIWRNVDFSRSQVHVEATLIHVKGRGVMRRQTKTDAGRRVIGVPPGIMAELHKLYDAALARCEATGETIGDLPVLTSPTGMRWQPNEFSKYVKAVLREAKLGALRGHDLRHTMATELLQELPVGVVQRRLGHSTPQITMLIYEHALPNENERATAVASKLVDL